MAGVPVVCCPLPGFLVIDPNNSANVYAGLVSGLYKTTNGGAGWRPLYTYTSADRPQFRNVFVNARNSNILYGFDMAKGIFESPDGGANWRAMDSGLAPGRRAETSTVGKSTLGSSLTGNRR